MNQFENVCSQGGADVDKTCLDLGKHWISRKIDIEPDFVGHPMLGARVGSMDLITQDVLYEVTL